MTGGFGVPAGIGEEPSRPALGAPAPAPVTTGEPAVDDAVAGVAAVAGAEPADQIGAYEAAYGALRDTLARIDAG